MIDNLTRRIREISKITLALMLAMYSIAGFSLANQYLPTGMMAWLSEEHAIGPRAVGVGFGIGALYLTLNLLLGRKMDITERYLATSPILGYVVGTVVWSLSSHAYQAATMYLLLYVLLHMVYVNPNGHNKHGH